MVAANAAAVLLPINGLSTGQVSALYPNFFVPDGLTFSIWSVIYTGLFAFACWSIASLRRQHQLSLNTAITRRISPLFWLSCLLNMGWIFAWHYLQVALSLGIMVGLLCSVLYIFIHVQKLQGRAAYWCAAIPFALYASWLCVAAIANTTALLVHYNWQGGPLSPQTWSIVMQVVATLVSFFVSFRYRSAAFAAVTAWALAGIWRGQPQPVGLAALSLAGIVVLAAIYLLVVKARKAYARA